VTSVPTRFFGCALISNSNGDIFVSNPSSNSNSGTLYYQFANYILNDCVSPPSSTSSTKNSFPFQSSNTPPFSYPIWLIILIPIGIVIFVAFVWLIWRRRNTIKYHFPTDRSDDESSGNSIELTEPSGSLKCLKGEIKILHLIGTGEFGRVFQGTYNMNEFAFKSLKNPSKESEQNLIKEAEILNSIKSPNIIVIFGYCTHRKVLYLVLEFMKNGDFQRYLAENSHSVDQLLTFTIDATLAVHSIHDMNLIHRDIAARNFLVSSMGKIKMSDFGMAKMLKKRSDLLF